MIGTLRSVSQRARAVEVGAVAARVFGDRPRSIHTASRKRDTAGSAESAPEVMAIGQTDWASLSLAGKLRSAPRRMCGVRARLPGNVVTAVW